MEEQGGVLVAVEAARGVAVCRWWRAETREEERAMEIGKIS